MNGAQIQELIGEARMRANWLDMHSAKGSIAEDDSACFRRLARALEGFQRSIVAHHEISTLSEDAIKESLGGSCQICARAQDPT